MKTENCQTGVFTSYVSAKGYGLLDKEIYLPKLWFSEGYEEKRKRCNVSENNVFRTENEIESNLIRKAVELRMFEIQWIGCDALINLWRENDF